MSDQRPFDDPGRVWASLDETPPPSTGAVPTPPPFTPPPGYTPLTFDGPSPAPPAAPRGPAPTKSGPSTLVVAVVGLALGAALVGAVLFALGGDDEPAPRFVPPTTVAVPSSAAGEAQPAPTPAPEPAPDETPVPAPAEETPAAATPAGWVSLSSDAAGHPVAWAMPEPTAIDGPRPARGVQANVTYWISGSDRPIRHDVAVLTDVEPGLDAEAAARTVIRAVQNDETNVGGATTVDGRTVLPFLGPYDSRMYEGVAYSWDGVVVLLSVGYFDPDDRNAARADLAAMEKSLTFGPP